MISMCATLCGLSNAQWAQYRWTTMRTGSNYQPYDSPVFFVHLLISMPGWSEYFSEWQLFFIVSIFWHNNGFTCWYQCLAGAGAILWCQCDSYWPHTSAQRPRLEKKLNRNRKRDPVYKVLEKRQNRNRQIKEMPPGGSHLGFAG